MLRCHGVHIMYNRKKNEDTFAISYRIDSFPPGQNGWRFHRQHFSMHFLNKNIRIFIQFSLTFVPKVQLTKSQCWFRQWLGTKQVTSHYLNQCWPSSLMHICGTRGRWVKTSFECVQNLWTGIVTILNGGEMRTTVHQYPGTSVAEPVGWFRHPLSEKWYLHELVKHWLIQISIFSNGKHRFKFSVLDFVEDWQCD